MKICKKWLKGMKVVMLCFLAAVLLMPQTAYAIDKIDEGADVTLTVDYGTDENPVIGAELYLYKVADVYGFGEFEPTEEFAKYPLQWNDLDTSQWKLLAEMLDSYIVIDGIEPMDSGVTNEFGGIIFPMNLPRMTTGLYLVRGEAYTYENVVYQPEPVLICLPNRNSEDEWIYDEAISMKYESGPEITELDVRKIWKGNDEKARPTEIEVELYQGSELYDTVVLNKENDWHYEWTDWEAGDEWKLNEKKVPDGYTVSVGRNGTSYIITNTYSGTVPKDDSNLPQTGMLWWPVPILAGAGILLFLSGWVKRQRSGE